MHFACHDLRNHAELIAAHAAYNNRITKVALSTYCVILHESTADCEVAGHTDRLEWFVLI